MSSPRPTGYPSAGFTLVELLTVIAIIGILAGILVAVVSRARATAQRADSLANLRTLGTVVNLCVQDNRGRLPGPLSTTQYAKKAGNTSQLGHWLAPYLAPNQFNGDVIRPLGHARFFSLHGDDLDNYTAYIANHKAHLGGVQSRSPWGYSGATNDNRIPQVLASIDNPSVSIAIMEADQELLTDTNARAATRAPLKPLFDDGRAVLFFDWHVKVVPFSVKMGNNR